MPRVVMGGVLGGGPDPDGRGRAATTYPTVEVRPAMTVTHRGTRFTGTVVEVEADAILVQGASGDRRLLRLLVGGFSVDGRSVTLVRPRTVASGGHGRTASGSVAAPPDPGRRARVAQASRIWVEGIHDAELVERVWGDDLRAEGIVVERLDGIDELVDHVARFDPGPGRRLGILVDHLVSGSKEQRLTERVRHPHVLVTGTPFVDVWQAVRPHRVGIRTWPSIPRGQPWKAGICEALGIADPPGMWRTLLASVRTYADLEPELVGAVERLIDFVSQPG